MLSFIVEMAYRMMRQGQSVSHAIIIFTDDYDPVSVVPTCWLDGDES
jgi:hypothetical protein